MVRSVLRILIVVGIVVSARSSLADHYHVPTGSMVPTVEVGDRILVNKAAYGLRIPLTEVYVAHFDGPERGDVVVLTSPEDGQTLLKRVVAVPGDHVAVRSGRVYIDGKLADGTHPLRLTRGGGPGLQETVVPAEKYLVMGDNRGMSHDGRSFGWVDRDAIQGRAVGIFYGDDPGFTWRDL